MPLLNGPRTSLVMLFLTGLLILSACSMTIPLTQSTPLATNIVATKASTPDWFNIKMTDVRTGQTFSMNDFSGKVVLVETMAEWCTTCVHQENEVKKWRV